MEGKANTGVGIRRRKGEYTHNPLEQCRPPRCLHPRLPDEADIIELPCWFSNRTNTAMTIWILALSGDQPGPI